MNINTSRVMWLGCFIVIAVAGCSRREPISGEKEKEEKRLTQSEDSMPTAQSTALFPNMSKAVQVTEVNTLTLPVGLASMSPDRVTESAQLQVQGMLVDGIVNPTSDDPKVRARVFAIWKVFAAGFENTAITGATPEVLAGQILPAQITALSVSGSSLLDLLRSGKVPFLSGNEEIYRAAGLYSSAMLAGSFAGDGVSALLSQRANQMPPSKLDLVAYFALGDGIREIGSGASHKYPAFEELAPYATAQNPIYRMLALQAMTKALPSGVTQPAIDEGKESVAINQARVVALRNYANESDPVIVGKLIEVLVPTSNKEALDTLKLIREQQVKLGAADMVQRVDQAIVQVDKLLKAQSSNP